MAKPLPWADDAAIRPVWLASGVGGIVPYYDEQCPSHDGKRCELLGRRAPSLCEPTVANAGAMEDRCGVCGDDGWPPTCNSCR